MSDLDDYAALFNRTGVHHRREDKDGRAALFVPSGTLAFEGEEVPEGSKNDGYHGFYAALGFSKEGELEVFGVWEGSWE